MHDGPRIADLAALLGDPARANMLNALMGGRALTVSELAQVAGVALPTASGHLAKLVAGALLCAERQGRHRYFRLSGPDVAQVLESLMGLAQRTGAAPVRTGPRDTALRTARICYDHLAGERGVALLAGLVAQGCIEATPPLLTTHGRSRLSALGVDIAGLERGRRPLCRTCLDWSERRDHLGGALAAAILERIVQAGWACRGVGRIISFTERGERDFVAAFQLPRPEACTAGAAAAGGRRANGRHA